MLARVLLGLWQISGVRDTGEISLETEDVSCLKKKKSTANKNPPNPPKSGGGDDFAVVVITTPVTEKVLSAVSSCS